MANIKSQKERVRTNEKARKINASVRSELKTHIKNANAALDAKADDSKEKVSTAQSRLNSAAAKGRIHKKAAARKTSRLMKKAATA